MIEALRRWSLRRWVVATVSSVVSALVLGIPTDLIPNPLFWREIPPTWWSYPTLALTSVLAGMLVATYVREPADDTPRDGRWGGVGGALSFFAIGCPVCNKIVLLALGTSGALQFFEPVQPVLAALSVVVLTWAVRSRLRNENRCAVAV